MYTFTIMVHIANVYIIFLPDFIYVSNDILKFKFENIFYDFLENVIEVLEII